MIMMECDSNPPSQSSKMDIVDLDGMDAAVLPQPKKKIRKRQKYAIRKLEAQIKNWQIKVDLSQAPVEELAPILRQFYEQLNTSDGKPPAPTIMNSVKAGIQRHINKIRCSPINKTWDKAFAKANGTFKVKRRLYAAMGNARARKGKK